MRHGIPLSDSDRAPWLAAIHAELVRADNAGQSIILACSALKWEYRDTLSANLNLTIVFLRGTVDQLHRNLAARANHFAGESLVPSQLATLEEPSGVIIEDIAATPEEIVEDICARLKT
jgi:carbohydrate kinase (thermoresistant glucokinase family)